MWPARRRARRIASARLLVAIQSLDQENAPYTSAVLEFVGGGSGRPADEGSCGGIGDGPRSVAGG